MRADRVFTNARLATMAPALPGLGIVENGVVAEQAGRIIYAGPTQKFEAAETIDCENRWITPGLIDCHTHLVYAGSRAGEFEARLAGASYEDIARAGGGIMATVAATRAASRHALLSVARARLEIFKSQGVTTIEIKSGYGLNEESELKLLRVITALAVNNDIDISRTFLGPHAIPPEYANSRAEFLQILCAMLPKIASENLADAVDAFCEGIAFTPDEVAQFFTAAAAQNLPVKLHADQLSNLHGAALAANFNALSADHLEYTGDEGAATMAAAGTIAVILPGAFFTLRETQHPPIAAFRAHKVPMAIATDLNPGTSPLFSPLLALNMAATQFRLTVEECLLGLTRHAAAALGRAASVGTLEPGKKCHLAIWNIERPAELVYHIGLNPLHQRIWSAAP